MELDLDLGLCIDLPLDVGSNLNSNASDQSQSQGLRPFQSNNSAQGQLPRQESDQWSFQYNRPDVVSYQGPSAHHQQQPQLQQIQKQQQQQQNHRHHDRTHPPLTHVRRASSQHSSPGRPRPQRASITTSILRPRRKRCSEPDVITRSSVLQNPLMRHDQRDREGDSEPELASFSAHSISAPSSPARSHQHKQSQASHVPQAPQRPPPPPPLQQSQLQSYQQVFPHPRLVVPSLSENDYTDLRNMFCRPSQSPPRSRALSPLRKSTSSQPGLVREQISESE